MTMEIPEFPPKLTDEEIEELSKVNAEAYTTMPEELK